MKLHKFHIQDQIFTQIEYENSFRNLKLKKYTRSLTEVWEKKMRFEVEMKEDKVALKLFLT